MALHAPSSYATIKVEIPKDNTANIPPEFLEEEKKAFQEKLTQKQRDIASVNRLVDIQRNQDWLDDENKWWNKLANITDAEYKLMPIGFIRKYGTYITNMQKYDRTWHLEENKSIYDYFNQIKNLNRLLTAEEKDQMIEEFKRANEPDIVTYKQMERERGDFMRRQPRIDPEKLSYNFEQYSRYTTILAGAKRVDDERSRKFYKLVKYVKKNKDKETDALVYDFTVNKELDPDLIDIPEEFQDLPIADVNAKAYKKR